MAKSNAKSKSSSDANALLRALPALKGLRFDQPGEPVDLAGIDPGSKPFGAGDKDADKLAADEAAAELDELQNRFYADRRHKLLVVLQGLDTSGKDGTLRHVFSHTSPIGVRVVAWKAPVGAEREHDYLWRIHQQVPGHGEIVAFNRSHYEDVLVPVVNGELSKAQHAQRLAHLNDFERMLTETGTTVLKFMLHISKAEQRERLQARLDDPEKRWKFDPADLQARSHWSAYQKAYAQAITATATPWAPWIVVPADSKTHRNLMISSVLRETLKGMDLRYPPSPPNLEGLKVK